MDAQGGYTASPGPVVMTGKSCSRVVSSNPAPNRHFWNIVLKFVLLFEKTENKQKMDRGWPIKKKVRPK